VIEAADGASDKFSETIANAEGFIPTMQHSIQKKSRYSKVILSLLMFSPAAFAGDGWRDLFNGKDLTGWEVRGGQAHYAVEDGVIVGSSVLDTPNSFLCTKETFSNFVLELDFKVDPALNSGVQFRSLCFDKQTVPKDKEGRPVKDAKGKEIEIPAGRVHGYQCEIDVDPAHNRWWTAGIYEEGRRGWLFPGSKGGDAKAFTEQGAKSTKQCDWNHLRIEADGPSITTWLNGEQRASIKDDLTPTGFFGFQVHGVGKDKTKAALKARFKNIRIKVLDKGAAPAK